MSSAKELIKVAEAEIGYLEKATNSNLDSDTGNAGSNNWTKYARDLDNLGNFYNGKKNGYSWCDVFVDWCFVKAFGVEEAKRLTCQPNKSMGAGCSYSAQYYKDKKRWYTTPKPGDQIFFKSRTYSYAHTGIVVAVDSTKVYTVEGNTSGASGVISNGGGVCAKSYPINSTSIVGYGRPDYTVTTTTTTTTTKPTTTTTTTEKKVSVEVRQLKKGSKDTDTSKTVTRLQMLLNALGYNAGTPDGDFGTKTDTAVRAFQKANGLDVDGVFGKDSWNKILG